MATGDEVSAAIGRLADRIDAAGPAADAIPERAIICVVPDLGTAFRGIFRGSRLVDIAEQPSDASADVRLTARSDDLIALIDGRLGAGYAFLTGKVRIDASPADLMLMRKLF